jgi:hypothetical protein
MDYKLEHDAQMAFSAVIFIPTFEIIIRKQYLYRLGGSCDWK